MHRSQQGASVDSCGDQDHNSGPGSGSFPKVSRFSSSQSISIHLESFMKFRPQLFKLSHTHKHTHKEQSSHNPLRCHVNGNDEISPKVQRC